MSRLPLSYARELERAQLAWRHIIADGFEVVGDPVLGPNRDSVVCIASGCSLAAAKVLETRLSRAGYRMTRCCTAYDFVQSGLSPQAGLIVSSKGSHPDALRSYEELVLRGARPIVFTNARSSPLAIAAFSTSNSLVVTSKVNVRDEGFLPAESVAVLLGMAMRAPIVPEGRQRGLEVLFETARRDHNQSSRELRLGGVSIIHILPAFHGYAAAIDLETRLAESGVATGVITDPWNVGHGRYMGIDAAREFGLVVTFSVAGEEDDIENVLALLPSEIPRLRVSAPFPGLLGSVYCVFRSMFLLSLICLARGIEPSQPSIPEWGNIAFRRRPEVKAQRRVGAG